MAEQTYFERMASRSKPIGMLATIEDPVTLAKMGTAIIFGSMTYALLFASLFLWFDEPQAALASVVLAAAYLAGWIVWAATGSIAWSNAIILSAGSMIVAALHVVLGGYAYSGAFLMWLISLTIAQSIAIGRNGTAVLVVIFSVVAIVFGFIEESIRAGREAPDATLTSILFVVVLVGSIVMVAPVLVYFLDRLSDERERAEGLLLNVLPAEVASELKETGATTARHYDGISVMFADIVGFTPMSAEMEPEEMVDQLNDVFTYFDELAERYGCEKIRTIGDNYMVASGLPTPREDHAQALCRMALDMLEYSQSGPLSFRLGINSGPAVAGVIGTRKFQYDVWGDTVNTASRMESHGEPGRIQVSDATYQLVEDTFATTPRGPIDVKGKGTMQTHWLDAARQPVTADG